MEPPDFSSWSQEEKEDYGNQRREEMRLKNEAIERRFLEVQKDKIAADRKSSVTNSEKRENAAGNEQKNSLKGKNNRSEATCSKMNNQTREWDIGKDDPVDWDSREHRGFKNYKTDFPFKYYEKSSNRETYKPFKPTSRWDKSYCNKYGSKYEKQRNSSKYSSQDSTLWNNETLNQNQIKHIRTLKWLESVNPQLEQKHSSQSSQLSHKSFTKFDRINKSDHSSEEDEEDSFCKTPHSSNLVSHDLDSHIYNRNEEIPHINKNDLKVKSKLSDINANCRSSNNDDRRKKGCKAKRHPEMNLSSIDEISGESSLKTIKFQENSSLNQDDDGWCSIDQSHIKWDKNDKELQKKNEDKMRTRNSYFNKEPKEFSVKNPSASDDGGWSTVEEGEIKSDEEETKDEND